MAVLLIGLDLGRLDLWAPDEPRYAQVAEELRRMERGPEDLVLLRLGGEPYTQKPPLYFWLAAALGALDGRVGEWSARLPSAVAGLATLAVWAAIGRRLFPGTAVAWTAVALLLTSFRFVHFARRAQLDVLLALFESLTLWGFLDWRAAATPRARRRALLVLHAATALALLTKGPVGLLPWACFATLLWSEGRARDIRRVLAPWGVALAATPVLAWVGASVALAPAGFFEAAVVDNVWSRFATGTAHVRPAWYFVLQLPIEALPWSLVWPVALAWAWRQRGAASTRPGHDDFARRLLVAWIALPFVFFSLSAGKRGIYLLPVLPALCLAVAAWLERLRASRLAGRSVVEGWSLPIALSALLGGAAALATPWRPPGAVAASAFDAGRTGLLAVAAVGMAASVAWRARAPRRVYALAPGVVASAAIVAAVFGVLLFAVLPRLEPEKSPQPIARAVLEVSAPSETIGLYGQPALQGGLLFYLDRLDPEGDRRIELLEAVDDVARFVRDGGRVVVTRARTASDLDAAGHHRTAARVRSGRRAQTVLVFDRARGSTSVAPAPGSSAARDRTRRTGLDTAG